MIFVIWGTGIRAAWISEILGRERIIAYIDNDIDKQNRLFNDTVVISLDKYRDRYLQYPIIITPTYYEKDIIEQLGREGINNYFRLKMCPSEMQGYGSKDVLNKAFELIDDEKYRGACVVGGSFYSLLVYEKLYELFDGDCYISEEYPLNALSFIDGSIVINSIPIDIVKRDKLKIILTCRTDDMEILEQTEIDLYDLSDQFKEYSHSKLTAFHDIHKGEKCFLIATGPSLREDDIKKIFAHNIDSFGVNRIFNIDANVWTPSYYVMVDKAGVEEHWKAISEYRVKYKFLNESVQGRGIINGEGYYMHICAGDDYPVLPKFSDDVSKKVYGHATVTYVALQLAVYMGYTEIYLLGVDCNYIENSKNNYFFEENKADNKNHSVDKMIMCYMAAKKYADEHNIKIYNATRGGKLEVFERVDFDSLFEDSKE